MEEREKDRVPEEGNEKPRKGWLSAALNKFYGIEESGSDAKTEIFAGVTTFMAMAYILVVNAGMYSESWVGLSYEAAYIATGLAAVFGTVLMSLFARMPLAQASGIGTAAFIVYTLLNKGLGLTYANCMAFVLMDGALFVLLTVTGLRKKIFEAIPAAVRKAIPIGIGLFIAFIGLQQAGVIVASSSTLVEFVSFNVLAEGFRFGNIVPPLVCLSGLVAIAALSHKKVKSALLWGILGSTVLFYALCGLGCAWKDEVCLDVFRSMSFRTDPFSAFAEWGREAAGKVFVEGFDFSGYAGNAGGLVLVVFTSALSLCMIDMFDTIGALYGACTRGNLLDERGAPLRMERMMLTDSVATCAGAMMGTSTVNTFVESSSGIAAGGKTGLCSLVTGLLFAAALFLSPIARFIPRSATASALLWVGVLMISSVRDIDWEDAAEAAVAFLTFIVMLLGYSIAKGIGVGIVAYAAIKICTGKIKEISVPTWVILALFLAMFLLT